MNNFKAAMALLLIFSVTPKVFSAEMTENTTGKEKIGMVSASGALTMDEVVAELSRKADQKGARTFKVLALGGSNHMYGVAEIYK